jgi:hypothetical protein
MAQIGNPSRQQYSSQSNQVVARKLSPIDGTLCRPLFTLTNLIDLHQQAHLASVLL